MTCLLQFLGNTANCELKEVVMQGLVCYSMEIECMKMLMYLFVFVN